MRTDHLWTGTRVILTGAPAHVYMAVVCRCELMGGDTAPLWSPQLDRSSWQIALQSSFSCSSPWGAVIDDSHCHLDSFSPPIWLLTGSVQPYLLFLSSHFLTNLSGLIFTEGVYHQNDFKTSTLYKLKTWEIIGAKHLAKPFGSWRSEIRKVLEDLGGEKTKLWDVCRHNVISGGKC